MPPSKTLLPVVWILIVIGACQLRAAVPVIELNIGGCQPGQCPVYDVAIFEDGTVVYVGKKFVDVMGKHESSIAKEQVAALLERAEREGFHSSADNSDIWGRLTHDSSLGCPGTQESGRPRPGTGVRGAHPVYVPYTRARIGKDTRVVGWVCLRPELQPLVQQVLQASGVWKWVKAKAPPGANPGRAK